MLKHLASDTEIRSGRLGISEVNVKKKRSATQQIEERTFRSVPNNEKT
jgi:hypothetical protein